MYIEVRKAAFVNKGAELMLRSILQRVSQEYPHAKFVMEPNKHASFEKRAKLGLYQKAFPGRYGLLPFSSPTASILPTKLKRSYGIVTNREIDIVLDASGFSYSDQLSGRSTQTLADLSKIWKRQGTKLILMPQAFGPFTSSHTKNAIKVIVENANLIFAREKTSYEHLVKIVGEQENIKIAPDFTNLLDGILPGDFDQEKYKFCIVPNNRMIEKTSELEKNAYMPFLKNCANFLLEKQAKPFILIHETERDRKIAEELSTSVNGVLPIIEEADPLKIKGILGACSGTIGSRFHGLVSALSQGVPSLGTGWSHKYQSLFEEYSFEEGLVDVCSDSYKQALELLIQEDSRKKVVEKLDNKSTYLKDQSRKMWLETFAAIEN